MRVDCQEYRKSMELVTLRKRLYKGIHDTKERKAVEERIKTIEKELEID